MLAGYGTNAFVSAKNRASNVEKGALVWIPSRLRSHFERYGVFELLLDSGYDMRLGYLTYRHGREGG